MIRKSKLKRRKELCRGSHVFSGNVLCNWARDFFLSASLYPGVYNVNTGGSPAIPPSKRDHSSSQLPFPFSLVTLPYNKCTYKQLYLTPFLPLFIVYPIFTNHKGYTQSNGKTIGGQPPQQIFHW